MIRVLVLPRYDRLGASSRLRMMQYFPWLVAAGFETYVSPLFSDAYVSGMQVGKRTLGEVVSAFTGRIKALVSSRSFDLIWIEKELLPWLPAWFEQVLTSNRVPYVLDYDDAVFHSYDQHHNALIRKLLGTKHPSLMRRAAIVVAGNASLANFAERVGAKRVEILPTVIDLERYPAATVVQRTSPPLVGWIGQSATAYLLKPYKQLFEHLSLRGCARFVAIGIDAKSLGLPMESFPWTEQTEVASISRFDIGIMPLADGPLERGKCGYKLIQYMACGLPVVASPVGVNRQIIEHGVDGFLAETPEQWMQALHALLVDADLRRRMGHAGRQKVEEQYSIQVTGPRLAALLQQAITTNKE